MYTDTTIIVIGFFLIILIFLIVFIPCTTNRINPQARKLSQEKLKNSLHKQEYKILKSLNTTNLVESFAMQEIICEDAIDKIYENIVWKNTKSIQFYRTNGKLILVIPEIIFTLEDWNFLQSKKIKRTRENDVEVIIHKELLSWTEEHSIMSKIKNNEDIYILAYHSGCFLAYGLYCLFDNIQHVTMYGPAKFFDLNNSKEIDIFISLSDIWSKLPLQETLNYWEKGIQIALNENEYKNMEQFQKMNSKVKNF